MAGLCELITRNGCRTVAVVGLAKNTGKTTTFNRIISEAVTPAHAGLLTRSAGRLLLAGYGHDGEHRDALFNHRKPRITAPPGSVYATIEEFAGPEPDREVIADPGIHTVLGNVRLYRAGPRGTLIELIGINRTSSLRSLVACAPAHDLFLIDGAVDRQSLAVPNLADGLVLATGAAVAGDLSRTTAGGGAEPACVAEVVAAATKDAVARLTLPIWQEASDEAIFIQGALTDTMALELLKARRGSPVAVVVADGTKLFALPATIDRLAQNGIMLHVRYRIAVIAVTVNPFNPWGPDEDPGELMSAVREALPGVTVLATELPPD